MNLKDITWKFNLSRDLQKLIEKFIQHWCFFVKTGSYLTEKNDDILEDTKTECIFTTIWLEISALAIVISLYCAYKYFQTKCFLFPLITIIIITQCSNNIFRPLLFKWIIVSVKRRSTAPVDIPYWYFPLLGHCAVFQTIF